MDLQLTDKVVVVTGAASGIGQAIAGLLTEEGAVVVGGDRDPFVCSPTVIAEGSCEKILQDEILRYAQNDRGRSECRVRGRSPPMSQ